MPLAARAAFGWPNWADTATLSGGDWRVALPLTHLVDARLARLARSADALAASTRFDVDLGAARLVQLVALPQARLSAVATWRITASASADFSAPLLETGWLDAWPVQWAEGVLPAGHPNAATRRLTNADLTLLRWDVLTLLDPSVTARYWRIEITDTTNPAGVVDLPRLWISPLYQPSINFRYGAQFGLESASVRQETLSGARLVDARPTRRTVQVDFGDLAEDEAAPVLHDLLRRVGVAGQCYWSADATDVLGRQRHSFLAQLAQLPPVVRASLRQNAVAVALEEVL
jgi:hypothetical protein